MLRSMYSGISGMKNFQTKLDVIGNNISNVNTYGFKKGRTVFKDLVSQQIAGANGPTAGGRGGVNPKQVGLGVQLAAIDTIHTEGSTQTTGRTLDLAISGDGFFQVNDGTNTYYTRAGNFYMDQNGDLINSDGFYLGEVGAPFNIPTTATSLSIGTGGTISYIDGGVLDTAQQIEIAKFANPEGLSKAGANFYGITDNSGEPEIGIPGLDGRGAIAPGSLEMSNVDLSEEFTEMIVAQRGFQANTRIITTSDEILQELMSMKR
ncbi:flagellar basal body rod protein FlgG [Domibacillus sp. A3M-37]|uniref:flagellar basal body rod protein FlgG n=1 Tax=Domibacillus sp. A3M-37 TaxID=2962037 RepID=UPI0020B839C4|nr:flagellar basal body rod protein FlgG [Domibacillus sp. A3M-37]MCP3761998.1 flagellar basal body rod protein FlgG [Domibacillus sp. A3M-37]